MIEALDFPSQSGDLLLEIKTDRRVRIEVAQIYTRVQAPSGSNARLNASLFSDAGKIAVDCLVQLRLLELLPGFVKGLHHLHFVADRLSNAGGIKVVLQRGVVRGQLLAVLVGLGPFDAIGSAGVGACLRCAVADGDVCCADAAVGGAVTVIAVAPDADGVADTVVHFPAADAAGLRWAGVLCVVC